MIDLTELSSVNINSANSKTRMLRKIRNVCFASAISITFLFIMIFQTGLLLNPVGDYLGYSGCPNCGDSWFWKSNGSITVEPARPLEENIEHIIYAEITKGIMICKECLAKPAELDEERIERDLLSYPEGGWTLEETAKVKEAVIRYKKEKLQNQGE